MAQEVKNTLHEIRTQKNLTQESIAARVGVSRQTIIAIEKGKYAPSVALALRLAHTFGLKVEDVFYLSHA